MKRTVVNPWPWSLQLGFNQAELVEGHTKELVCSGQTSMDADGNPQHEGDMRAQIAMAMDNVEVVLAQGGMSLANVVRLNLYTTDVDAFFANYDVITDRTAAAGIRPTGTLLGVSRLAFPELLVELEATAVA